ncbi:MAG TPA: hypothetical protein VIF38_10600 [Burkholderiales bacterium]|jgi:hypothetical protein
MPAIDPQRLLADLRALRGIGAQGRGVVRPAFSASDMEARRWLKRRYEEAGLEATIDGVGNVLGTQGARRCGGIDPCRRERLPLNCILITRRFHECS